MAGPQGSHPGRVGGEQAARGQGDGSGGNRGGNQGGRGGGSFGSRRSDAPPHANKGGGQTAGLGNRGGFSGVGGQGGKGSQTFNGANVPGNPSAPGYLDYDNQTTQVQGKNVKVGDLRNDYHDYEGTGDSLVDQIGNFLAGSFGFNEENPFEDKDYADGTNPTGAGANWGFDPVPGLVGIGSMLAGLPFGPGTIANLASSAAGRPLAFDLGPSALTSDTIDPETGQVVGSSTTHTGPNMTVRDSDNPDTYFGMSPGLAAAAGGASNSMPGKQTFMGTDPTTQDPAEGEPFTPTTPNPTQVGTLPYGMNFDVGNTGLTPQQLSDLFAQHMGKSNRKTPASVIV
jgi:hypothetical protein